jgi:hypothetical protein
LIFDIIEEVPPLDEHATNILHSRSVETDCDIGPSHPGSLRPVKLVLVGMSNVAKVEDSGVVIVLAGEYNVCRVIVNVSEGMLVSVPTTVAHVQSTHKCNRSIDYAELFMMSPVQNDTFVDTVDTLHGVDGHLPQFECVERQVLQRRGNGSCQALTVWQVVRMTENSNVRVECFKVVFRMGRGNCASSATPHY